MIRPEKYREMENVVNKYFEKIFNVLMLSKDYLYTQEPVQRANCKAKNHGYLK